MRLILIFFACLFFHNAWFYSPHSGYDAGIHQIYTQIITWEKRIPLPVDTPESYNPPMFYWLSGQLAKLSMPLFNGNFLDALKSWQLLIAGLLLIAGYLWFDIYKTLNSKAKGWGFFFIFWLLSLPVVNKMAPMYNLETPQLILTAVTVWYFVKFVINKPTLLKIIILGLLGGIMLSLRAMAASVLLSLGLMIIILAIIKKISWKQMLAYNLVFTLVTLIIGGQYYWHFRDQGVFDTGENMAEIRQTPFLKRQPKSFYLDTFFRTMMRTPIRPNFSNRFIPIFYSTFWGDYWNYYRQRRFPLSVEEEIRFANETNKVKISKERMTLLVWQNRINLIPTFIIILGMFSGTILAFKNVRKKPEEVFLAGFFWATWLLFIYTNIQYPNTYKGDTIKASYILYSIPTLIYFATNFLIGIKKIKWIFYPATILIIVSWLFNLNFSWY